MLGGKYLGSSSCLRKPTQFKLIFKRGEFALDVDIGKAERWAGNVRSLLKGDLPPSFFFFSFLGLLVIRLCSYHLSEKKKKSLRKQRAGATTHLQIDEPPVQDGLSLGALANI